MRQDLRSGLGEPKRPEEQADAIQERAEGVVVYIQRLNRLLAAAVDTDRWLSVVNCVNEIVPADFSVSDSSPRL